MSKTEETQELAAAKAGMDVKTARKYLNAGNLPSESKPERTWRTRKDPFERVGDEIQEQVEQNLAAFESLLPPQSRPVLLQRILPTSWYPEEALRDRGDKVDVAKAQAELVAAAAQLQTLQKLRKLKQQS